MMASAAICVAAERVRIATPAQRLLALPVTAAMRNGYFATEGLEVYQIQIQPKIAVKALLAAEIDYVLAWQESVQAAMMGAPIKGVAILASRPLQELIARAGIRSARDLRGKTIGVDFSGGTVDYLSRAALRYLGLGPGKDVSVVETGNAQVRWEALKDGSIDAALVGVALSVRAEAQGFRRLVSLGDLLELPKSALATTMAKLAKQREQVKKVIRATLRGTRFIKQKRAETIQMIRSDLKMTHAQAVKAYEASVGSFTDHGLASERAVSLNVRWSGEELPAGKYAPVNPVVDWSVIGEIKLEQSRIPFWIRRDDP